MTNARHFHVEFLSNSTVTSPCGTTCLATVIWSPSVIRVFDICGTLEPTLRVRLSMMSLPKCTVLPSVPSKVAEVSKLSRWTWYLKHCIRKLIVHHVFLTIPFEILDRRHNFLHFPGFPAVVSAPATCDCLGQSYLVHSSRPFSNTTVPLGCPESPPSCISALLALLPRARARGTTS